MRFSLTVVPVFLLSLAAPGFISENSVIAGRSDIVFRPDSTTLCLVTLQGDTVVFKDQDGMERFEDYAVYRVIDFLPRINYWVIETGGYEWMEWCIVNGENGSTYTAISAPEPSPDNTRLLCAKQDITAGFIYNGIQVWRVDPEGLALEFEDVDVPWGPVSTMWEGDSTIVFKKHSYNWETGDQTFLPGLLTLSPEGSWIPDNPEDWEMR